MTQTAPSRQARRRSLLWREAVDGWLFILPWLLGFVCFTAGPMIASAVLSFTEWKILKPPELVGLRNFATLARDPMFRLSLSNTVYYTFLGVPIYLAASLAMALLLNMRVRGTAFYRTIYYLPSLTPAVANALLWVWILNPDFGLANVFLSWLGLPPQKWLFDAQLAKPCFIVMGLWGTGRQMVVFLAGLQGIPPELHEAAGIDGAGSWQRFWHVTLAMISPTVFFNLVTSIIGSFQVFTTAYVATQGGPQNSTLFLLLYIYRNAFEYFKMGYASALAWVLFVMVLILTLIQFKFAHRFVYYEMGGAA